MSARPEHPRMLAASMDATLWEVAPSSFTLSDARCPRACAHTVGRFTSKEEAIEAFQRFTSNPPPFAPCAPGVRSIH